MTTPNRRSRVTAWAMAIAAMLGATAPAVAGNAAIRACVEQGGTYLEDGTCEIAGDSPATQCRKQGGQYVGRGECLLPEQGDPIENCKEAGGIIMQEGRCYGPAKRR